MANSDLYDKHIELVEAVNNAATRDEHDDAELLLRGFRVGLKEIMGTVAYGNSLMACDMHYLDQGIDRPMCCGVWSDWEPKAEAQS